MHELSVSEIEVVGGGFIMVTCAVVGLLVTAFGVGVALGAADDSSIVCKP